MLRNWRRRKAIRTYLSRLPGLLARDYGRAKHYTPQQIRATVCRYRLPEAYACYALCIYARRVLFERDHLERGESCDYDAMRLEIGESFFDGKSSFTIGDVAGAFALSDAELGAAVDVAEGGGDAGGGHDY